MADHARADPPSPFVERWIVGLVDRVPTPPRALDMAMGRGRHASLLAAAGYQTFGVDINFDAVRHAIVNAASNRLIVRGWCADLTMLPLPSDAFALVLVTRYLQRDLFESIRQAVRPGGFIVYETFTEAQRAHQRGPTSPSHLLRPGELRSQFEGFDVIFYEEVSEPDAVARIVARRPGS
jgi:SAM-dependent methyltransferase